MNGSVFLDFLQNIKLLVKIQPKIMALQQKKYTRKGCVLVGHKVPDAC